MRTITALTATAGLLISLTACATSAPTGECTPSHGSGDSSSLVTAAGTFGAEPKAEFNTPLVTKGIEVSVVTAGKGETIYPGEYATFQATAYDATTGAVIIQAAYDPESPLTVRAGTPLTESDGPVSKFGQIFECQSVGSRVAATLKASELYGFGNVDESTPGLSDPDATVVIVADIQGSILAKAHGVPQVPQQGMPSVVTTPDGIPGVTIVGDAPKTLQISVLQQADGETVEEGDTIYLHYLRVNWDSPKTLKSTWTGDSGNPQPVIVATIDTTTGAGLNPGMLTAVKGQKVGSQILAIVPPGFGFPDGTAPSDVSPDDTLVYVIDILGIKSK